MAYLSPSALRVHTVPGFSALAIYAVKVGRQLFKVFNTPYDTACVEIVFRIIRLLCDV